MCEYCENEKSIESNDDELDLTIEGNILTLNEPRSDYWGRIIRTVEINFCPMCGKDLKRLINCPKCGSKLETLMRCLVQSRGSGVVRVKNIIKSE